MMKKVLDEIARIRKATGYSLQGLKQAWVGEAAFRFEVVLACVLIPLALLLPLSIVERWILIASVVFVLVVELLNSAVEAAIDRIGSERHALSGQAKDMGSAAVFVGLNFLGITWLLVLANHFWPF